MKTRDVRSVLSLGALLGLVVALFAAAEFFDASLRGLCSINSFFSCALVDRSGRTSTLGLPDYLWGIGGFVVILIVAGIAERYDDDARWEYLLVLITTAGIGFSLYFLYVELALIHALCIVCAVDYVFGAVAWVAAIVLARRARAGRLNDGAEDRRASPS